MSVSSGFVGGCTTIYHLLAAYPKVAACAAILGLGVGGNAVLSDGQLAECDAKIAACQVKPPAPPPVPVVVAPPVAPPPPVVVAAPKPVIDPCADAPVITTADLFVSTGKPFLWKNPGIDSVRGKAPQPYLAQLRFTPAEQKVFLEKIAKQDGTMTTLKKGDVIGLMVSGTGRSRTNTTVAFNPIAQTGDNHKNDNRLRVYTHEQLVRLNGDCVLRQMVLLEPFVCQNWARLSDVISPYPKK